MSVVELLLEVYGPDEVIVEDYLLHECFAVTEYDALALLMQGSNADVSPQTSWPEGSTFFVTLRAALAKAQEKQT